VRLFPSFRGSISPARYALAVTGLILSQYGLVAAIYFGSGLRIPDEATFWLLPLRLLAQLPGLSPWAAGLCFTFWLAVTWPLAALSFRRASRAGHLLAIVAVVPGLQIGAILLLAVLPGRTDILDEDRPVGVNLAHVLQGALAGISIIVLAVLISAVTFGAYGWGLFVMTPFLAGLATAYIANRDVALPRGRTTPLVMAAAALGSLALIMCALEGLACVLIASPLGALLAAFGGAIGQEFAAIGHKRGKPLLSVALLPALFALEAVLPPAIPIDLTDSVEIDASPSAVWRAVASDEAIGPPPWAIAVAGFAYPIRGRMLGRGVGAERIGLFSTGIAHERVTEWVPQRRLSFILLDQPPMMEEMSPYRRVHAPHVQGYFTTIRTSFELQQLGRDRTRLTIADSHMLRLDPALYWEPLARWAIAKNVAHVLQSIKHRAEAKG
jgi:hypothetical protein